MWLGFGLSGDGSGPTHRDSSSDRPASSGVSVPASDSYGGRVTVARSSFDEDDPPELQVVLDALDDPDCRRIIKTLDAPLTAAEISETCDIPRSTAYRKLELLSEASLVDERVEVRSDGHHTTRYVVDFEEVNLGLDDDREIEIVVERPERSPDERVAALWEEVRKGT